MSIGIGIGIGVGGEVLLPPTSYSNPGGTGNRTALITTTTNIPLEPVTGGVITALVNGDFGTNSTGSCFFLSTGTTLDGTKYIRWQFQTPKRITEFKYYQDRITTQGTWKYQASQDASTWFDVSANFTISATVTTTDASGNSGYYFYYQQLGLSGTVDGTPWTQEVEFKIA